MKEPFCHIHNRKLTCSACEGSRGGSVTGGAKAEAAKKNAQLATAAREKAKRIRKEKN